MHLSSLHFRLLPVFVLLVGSMAGMAQQALSISDRRELFVDDYLIDSLKTAELQMHSPVDEGEVLSFNLPWEGAFSAYVTILQDEDIYKAYYRGVPTAGNDGNSSEVTCYATSRDGIHWEKPHLGIHEIVGNKNNNIILADAAPFTHNFSPFIDRNPAAKPEERFKALGGTSKSGLVAFVSPDGVHWKKMQEAPVFTQGAFDSQNVAFWSESENQYVCYFRSWTGDGYQGFRSVSRTTSPDFIHWTDPEPMGFGNRPYEHLYTQQTSPYFRAPHIYLAIGARFMPNRKVISDEEAEKLGVNPKYYNDCSDAILMSSRGGNRYYRQFMESLIRPGIGLQNWVSRSNYPALNLVQTGPEEMSLYVNQDYAQPSAHLRRYSMRLDGLASLSAGYEGGEMLTRPFTFEGDKLELNLSTSAAGEVKVELLDAEGNKLPGYSLEECRPLIGNLIAKTVYWNNNADVSELAGKSLRMRIRLKDADVFSFRFHSQPD